MQSAELERKREEEKVHQFFMGLDEEGFGAVRSNVLSTEPMPNLNRTYAMMVQQERVRTITRGHVEGVAPTSFAVQAHATTRIPGLRLTPKPQCASITDAPDMTKMSVFS